MGSLAPNQNSWGRPRKGMNDEEWDSTGVRAGPFWLGQKRVGGSEAKAPLTDGCLLAPLAPEFSSPHVHTGSSELGGGRYLFPVFLDHCQVFPGKDYVISETPTVLNCSPLVSFLAPSGRPAAHGVHVLVSHAGATQSWHLEPQSPSWLLTPPSLRAPDRAWCIDDLWVKLKE